MSQFAIEISNNWLSFDVDLSFIRIVFLIFGISREYELQIAMFFFLLYLLKIEEKKIIKIVIVWIPSILLATFKRNIYIRRKERKNNNSNNLCVCVGV